MGFLFRKEHVTIGEPVYFKEVLGLSWLQFALGYTGAFSIEGTPESEAIFGTRRIEGILGDAGNDYLDAGDGDDMIYGGDGRDTIVGATGDGSDTVDGGDGYDLLLYDDNSTIPVSFDIARQVVRRDGETDTLINMERVRATDSTRDVVTAAGSDEAVTINLMSGSTQGPLGSMDVSRFEFAVGGTGNDRLIGSNANNRIRGNDGNDSLDGNGGNDTLDGGLGDDTLISGAGDDVLDGGSGVNDLANYSEQAAITFNTVTNQVSKPSGTDFLIDIDIILASSGLNDVLDASAQSESVTLNLNTQTMAGTTSGILKVQDFEHLLGGAGNDNLQGDGDVNSITGGGGNDTINARAGNDTVILGVGHGNDTIDGGSNTDIVDYQADTAAITFNVQSSTVADGTSTDTLDNVETIRANASLANVVDASTANEAVTVNLTTQVLSGPGDVETLIGFRHIIGGESNDTLTGDTQNNSITGGEGDDTMSGGDGDDMFILGEEHGDDSITGGDGEDTVDYSDTNDTITYNTESGVAQSSDSTDLLAGIEILLGGTATNDVIDASDELSAVTINLNTGSALGLSANATSLEGFERIIGGAGDDTLTGSDDDNTLTGGLGADTLDGGDGDDTFVYLLDSGDDVISDTTSGDSDVLNLTVYALADVTSWHAVDTDDGGDELDALEIVLADGNTIRVLAYFDNSTEVMGSVVAGDGVLSSINFSGNDNQDFSEVAALLS